MNFWWLCVCVCCKIGSKEEKEKKWKEMEGKMMGQTCLITTNNGFVILAKLYEGQCCIELELQEELAGLRPLVLAHIPDLVD